MAYNPQKIEKKWQKVWAENNYKQWRAEDFSPSTKLGTSRRKKLYLLVEFPYTSGEGMHVGHCRSYAALDVLARKKRMEGYNVLYPMGWDAFGLPTENYAIKTGVHPVVITKKNIARFKKQLQSMGLSFDWSREINTTDPRYYKWTQWIFIQFFKKGLAYQAEMPINWCPSCKIGLANEEVIDNKCERCGAETEKRNIKQWLLKITDYAKRLLDDLEKVNYLDKIKTQQINWIGQSCGAEIKFPLATSARNNPEAVPPRAGRYGAGADWTQKNAEKDLNSAKQFLTVFTTRLDTIFGCTYCVVAPEHFLVASLLGAEQRGINPEAVRRRGGRYGAGAELRGILKNGNEVQKYIEEAKKKSDLQRTELEKEKSGVELKGIKAINPFTKEAVPIFVADYVLGHYGTGAVMAVPAHDERDFAFAKKYHLPVIQSISRKQLTPRSYLMGGANITDKELGEIGVKILDKKENGDRGLEVPEERFKDYISLVKEKIENGFWNEIVGHDILFIFKNKEGCVKEIVLNKDTAAEIEKLGAEYNEEPYLGETSTWRWLAENKLYTDLILHTEDGILVNSDDYSGIDSQKAREKMAEWLEKNNLGGKKITYKLRDWVFSRQHYWGEPIPLVFCDNCRKKLMENPKSEIRNPKQIQNSKFKIQNSFNAGELLNPGWIAISEKDLPVILPNVKNYKPTDTGESPLAKISSWVNTECPKCGGKARRETDTMPNWAGSSWYYLAYLMRENPKFEIRNPKQIQNSKFKIQNSYKWDKKKINYWMPVDLYNGGMEHTTLHLLYSRFWHKFLYDLKLVKSPEPYQKRISHGMVLGEGGIKMSKSKDNVVNPDEQVQKYGADSLRLYEMFMGPFDEAIPWDPQGIVGMRRWLERIWKIQSQIAKRKAQILNPAQIPNSKIQNLKLEKLLHKTIKKVSEDIENFHFNTAISAMMIFTNELEKEHPNSAPSPFGLRQSECAHPNSARSAQASRNPNTPIRIEYFEQFLKLLAPFAPHLAEEIWQSLANCKPAPHRNEVSGAGSQIAPKESAKADLTGQANRKSIFQEEWPKYNPRLIKEETFELVVQINGKVRDKFEAAMGISEEKAMHLTMERKNAKMWIIGKPVKRVVFIKNKLINIVC